MAFIITFGAMVFCMAAVLAKNSKDIVDLKYRMDNPAYGKMVNDPED